MSRGAPMNRARRPVCKQMGIKKRSVLPLSRQRKISSGRGAAQSSPAPSPLPSAPTQDGAVSRFTQAARGAADASTAASPPMPVIVTVSPSFCQRAPSAVRQSRVANISSESEMPRSTEVPLASPAQISTRCAMLLEGGAHTLPRAVPRLICIFICSIPHLRAHTVFPRSRHAWFPRRGRKAGE